MLNIEPAKAEQINEIKTLFQEYAASLHYNLCFQDFETELRTLPGKYEEPRGTLLIATDAGKVAGCVALRPLDEEHVCEMKRLYVRTDFQNRGIGAKLIASVIRAAEGKGYTRMRLDTMPSMTSAISLYRKFGFYEIAAYCVNPVSGALFMEATIAELAKAGDK